MISNSSAFPVLLLDLLSFLVRLNLLTIFVRVCAGFQFILGPIANKRFAPLFPDGRSLPASLAILPTTFIGVTPLVGELALTIPFTLVESAHIASKDLAFLNEVHLTLSLALFIRPGPFVIAACGPGVQ